MSRSKNRCSVHPLKCNICLLEIYLAVSFHCCHFPDSQEADYDDENEGSGDDDAPAPPPPRQPDNKKKGKDNQAGKGNKKEPKKTGINNNNNGFNSKDEVRGRPTSTTSQPVSNCFKTFKVSPNNYLHQM